MTMNEGMNKASIKKIIKSIIKLQNSITINKN